MAVIVAATSTGDPDVGGYDAYLTRTPSGASIGLGNPSTPSDTPNNSDAKVSHSSSTSDGTDPTKAATGRRLKQVVVKAGEDTLDAFRRADARGACSHNAAYGWRLADMPRSVDVGRYRAMVAGHGVVDILAEAARLLNE